MRKTIDILGWTFVVLTILALMFTLLTTYNLGYVKYFNNYRLLQGSIFFTMLIWAFKLYGIDTGKRKWAYSMIFFIFAIGSLAFVFSYVK